MAFAHYIDQVLQEELPDNHKFEYPEIEEYKHEVEFKVEKLKFYDENYSSSGNIFFTEMKQLLINELF